MARRWLDDNARPRGASVARQRCTVTERAQWRRWRRRRSQWRRSRAGGSHVLLLLLLLLAMWQRVHFRALRLDCRLGTLLVLRLAGNLRFAACVS